MQLVIYDSHYILTVLDHATYVIYVSSDLCVQGPQLMESTHATHVLEESEEDVEKEVLYKRS